MVSYRRTFIKLFQSYLIQLILSFLILQFCDQKQRNSLNFQQILNYIIDKYFHMQDNHLTSPSPTYQFLTFEHSPIHLIDFNYFRKNQNSSPFFDQFDEQKPFKKIIENENQQSSEAQSISDKQDIDNFIPRIDIFGNSINPPLSRFQIGEFSNTKIQNQDQQQNCLEDEDKQNCMNKFTMATPLKLKKILNNANRSPLQDITPSVTKKKRNWRSKRQSNNTQVKHFLQLMTPKTMAQSRLTSQSIQRMKISRM